MMVTPVRGHFKNVHGTLTFDPSADLTATTEYSSHCAQPIVHKAGELSVEQGGLSHWWKNTSKEPVVLISADIAQDPNEQGM